MRALLKQIKMPPDAATTPDAAKALGLHLAGYTYVEIAAEMGCTPGQAGAEGNEAMIWLQLGNRPIGKTCR